MAQKVIRLMSVLAGIVLGQAVLYGPSLAGRKVLLPLDILAGSHIYLPRTTQVGRVEAAEQSRSDLIYTEEPARRFAASEFHAGRLPMWAPYQFAGAPFIWAKFSPFLALQFCTASPTILAWTQLLAAIVAGLGAHFFFRRVLEVGFWAAAICAWCYPITGFFVLWQGYRTSFPVCWLPWMLLAVDRTAQRNGRWAPAALSLLTCLVLVSGQLDVAGQVLLASGLYAAWRLVAEFVGGRRARFPPPPGNVPTDLPSRCRRDGVPPAPSACGAVLKLATGWCLGFLLAAPYILPVLEYTRTGARMLQRGAGHEERPPVGLKALPETIAPDIYGTDPVGRVFLMRDGNQLESAGSAYTGLLATLLVAPLAFCSRRHLAISLFWVLLSFFALSWCLNIPGLVHLLRLPGLRMMSHNRFVFAASFAILAMSAVGLEVFSQGPVQWRWWFGLPLAVLVGLFGWFIYRSLSLPEPFHSQLALALSQGKLLPQIHDLDGLRRMQAWFIRHYAQTAVLCGLGIGGWLFLLWRRPWQSRLLPVLAGLLAGDLLWLAYGRSAQCDPALYFPPIPVLDQIANSVPGRVIGFNCLPVALSSMCGLRDVRGYDAVDPAHFTDLMAIARDPRSHKTPYALTQGLLPTLTLTPEGNARLSPILDMLDVRYVIFRGVPAKGARPLFQGPDYWVLLNPAVLDRVSIPRRVETVIDDTVRLEKLASPQFDPREVAYVETQIDLPASCQGTAEIVSEIPNVVTVSLRMETPGLVVQADLWDRGWRAYLEGKPVPILRTNHALRGVVVPAGSATLEFRYQPASFAWGLKLAGLAAVVLLGWAGALYWEVRHIRPEAHKANLHQD